MDLPTRVAAARAMFIAMNRHTSYRTGRFGALNWAIGLAAAIAAGIALRLVCLADIEFKPDEAWALAEIETFRQSHTLPWLGIESSTGLPHPPLNLWVFLALGAVLPTPGPLE